MLDLDALYAEKEERARELQLTRERKEITKYKEYCDEVKSRIYPTVKQLQELLSPENCINADSFTKTERGYCISIKNADEHKALYDNLEKIFEVYGRVMDVYVCEVISLQSEKDKLYDDVKRHWDNTCADLLGYHVTLHKESEREDEYTWVSWLYIIFSKVEESKNGQN